MRFRISSLLCLTSLLFATSAASAFPAVSHQNSVLTTTLLSEDNLIASSQTVNSITGTTNQELATLGRELLRPPTNYENLSSTSGNFAKSLPAVPAAMLMVLTGFVCVSLVRDRRVWLAALAGLLWIGQTGIVALPQLALRFSHRNSVEQQPPARFAHSCPPGNSPRFCGDLKGTQYIGLLHYLAGIPEGGSNFFTRLRASITLGRQRQGIPDGICSVYHTRNTCTYASAILSYQYSLNPLLNRRISDTKQFVCFSPAFIFQRVSRGPPVCA